MSSPRLVSLIDGYKRAHGVPEAALARRIGISRQNLSLWRTAGLRALPAVKNLESLAEVIGRPYLEVLDAALRDAGYLHDEELVPASKLRIGDRVTATRGNGHRTLQAVGIRVALDEWGDLLIDFIDTENGEEIQHPNMRHDDLYRRRTDPPL